MSTSPGSGSTLDVANEYLAAWQRKDEKALCALVHPNVHFKWPVAQFQGRDVFVDGARTVLPILKEFRVSAVATTGDRAIFAYDFVCVDPIGTARTGRALITVKAGVTSDVESLFRPAARSKRRRIVRGRRQNGKTARIQFRGLGERAPSALPSVGGCTAAIVRPGWRSRRFGDRLSLDSRDLIVRRKMRSRQGRTPLDRQTLVGVESFRLPPYTLGCWVGGFCVGAACGKPGAGELRSSVTAVADRGCAGGRTTTPVIVGGFSWPLRLTKPREGIRRPSRSCVEMLSGACAGDPCAGATVAALFCGKGRPPKQYRTHVH